ncbi:hypothetical protein PITC_008690 [Penicillium italicum]|uniref:FHA domain-containing protein n=1 Tax=Penicillium italicum TaxID=40296 RepID=A0A0A2LCK9_PENIT|nr:hypothetical protein PITC_008690 [Penicillium italicum]
MSLGRLVGLEHDIDHVSPWTLSRQHGCFNALTSAWAQRGCIVFESQADSGDYINMKRQS